MPIVEKCDGIAYVVDNFRGNPTANSEHEYRPMNVGIIQAKFVSNVAQFLSHIKLLAGNSYEMIPLIPDRSLDICFIDADHRYASVKRDIALCLGKVKVGGILCGHDLDTFEGVEDFSADDLETDWVGNCHPGVTKAVDDLFGRDVDKPDDHSWAIRVKDTTVASMPIANSLDVSILIATCRPHSQYSSIIVERMKSVLEQSNLLYEFVICSQEPVNVEKVRWVREPLWNTGSIHPFNLAYQVSRGQYIYVISDDCYVGDNFLDALAVLKSMSDRRYKVTFLGLNREHEDGVRFGDKTYPAMGYPVFDRNTVENEFTGLLFNPSFKHHYADNWLLFFLAESGEPPIGVVGYLEHLSNRATISSNDWYDKAIFHKLVSQYHEVYDEMVTVELPPPEPYRLPSPYIHSVGRDLSKRKSHHTKFDRPEYR
jgi:hypothetical protein